MDILKNFTYSSVRSLVLQKISTKISVVTVVSSIVFKLQITYLTGATILDDVLTCNNDEVVIFHKRMYHQHLTLAAMFLGDFTEVSVFPQTILSCIASNVCHF